MTALAMGAATRPPVASLPMLPPSSTTTATAIVGFARGAKPRTTRAGCPIRRAARCRSCPPPHAGDLRGGAGAHGHHVDHHRGQLGGGPRRDGLSVRRGVEALARPGPTSRGSRGRAAAPSPPRRSRWRMRPAPSGAGSPPRSPARSPSTPAAAGSSLKSSAAGSGPRRTAGRTGLSVEPEPLGLADQRSAPRRRPISPNMTLHETVSAWSSVIWGAPPRQHSPPKFCSVLRRLRQVQLVRVRDTSSPASIPSSQSRGGRDELERGTRRKQLLRGPREQRLARVARAAASTPLRSTAVSCEASGVRVERRVRHHGQDLAGPGVHRHHARPAGGPAPARRPAAAGVERGDHRARPASAGRGSRRPGSAEAARRPARRGSRCSACSRPLRPKSSE